MAKILIVEDEENIAALEKDYIENAGHVVDIVGNGEKAIRLTNKEDYDLVVLDIMLPGIDGFTVCKSIRDNKKDMPIIIISALKSEDEKIKSFKLGADDYMTKPFSFGEMVARINVHLSRYKRLKGLEDDEKENNLIEIRDLVIDKDARRVFICGIEKVFTNKEFDLLCFLAENPDKVFTKEELFRKIWEMDSFGDISTVTVHIKKIREKIEVPNTENKYIETIWGMGYRFKL